MNTGMGMSPLALAFVSIGAIAVTVIGPGCRHWAVKGWLVNEYPNPPGRGSRIGKLGNHATVAGLTVIGAILN
jgi:hypothetical protein